MQCLTMHRVRQNVKLFLKRLKYPSINGIIENYCVLKPIPSTINDDNGQIECNKYGVTKEYEK